MLKELIPVRGGDVVPNDTFLALREQMDRVFDDWFNTDFDFGTREIATFTPRVDLTENDKEIHVSFELPGIDRKDVNVELLPGRLVVSGKKESDVETKKEKYLRRERFYGAFRREIGLPTTIDESAVKAEFDHGVLCVTLPKTAKTGAVGRKVEIR